MPVPYISAQALLAIQASTLAAEATSAGLTSLASALTSLSTEISGATITESDFFGTSGAGNTWAEIIASASSVIKTKVENDMLNEVETIQGNLTNIDANIVLQTTAIEGLKTDLGILSSNSTEMLGLAKGPGIRMIGPYEWLGFISSYIFYINKGEILKVDGNVSPEEVTRALAELQAYFEKFKNLPTNFD